MGTWGVVRLVPDDNVGRALGIAEGIENALTAMQLIGWGPTWAAGSQVGIKNLPVMPFIEAVTIFADADDSGVGLTAARCCAERWGAVGREATIHVPPEGQDWNDAAQGLAPRMSPLDTPEGHIRAVGGRTEALLTKPDQQQQAKEHSLDCIRLDPVGAANLPPRPWAYGNFLLFGQAAALGGVDGSGKGSMAVSMAIAMITGRPLLGEKVWRTGPVAIISYEDDGDEWHRRIAAACAYHGVDYTLAISNIHFLRKGRDKICFATMGDNGPIFPDGNAIITAVLALRAAMLIIDPWNHVHGFADGNSNALMAQVAGEVNRIASETSAAVLVLHHLRKGATGEIDDLMGATSLRATFRSTRILKRMTPDEGTSLGIANDTWRYSRISGSKVNYSPPVDQATWFQLMSVALDNADLAYPEGDECGVTACWQPPAVFDGLDARTLGTIFDRIRRGPGEGEDYRPNRQAKLYWVGHAILACTDKSETQAAKIIKLWLENNVLLVQDYTNPRTRRNATRAVLNEDKVTAIVASLRAQGAGV